MDRDRFQLTSRSGGYGRPGHRSFLIAAAACVVAAACQPPASAGRLDGGFRSVDALLDSYLEAAGRRDADALHRHRVTEAEHNELLWPEFPASRPERNVPLDWAWGNVDRTSVRDAERVIQRFGGRVLDTRGWECRKGVTEYETFRVHGDCYVIVRDPTSGDVVEAKLFGSLVEMYGRFKIVGILTD